MSPRVPDKRTGLMSGSSAPVSCTNADPSTAEAQRVQRNFASGLVPAADGAVTVYIG
jgi:snapalysin